MFSLGYGNFLKKITGKALSQSTKITNFPRNDSTAITKHDITFTTTRTNKKLHKIKSTIANCDAYEVPFLCQILSVVGHFQQYG